MRSQPFDIHDEALYDCADGAVRLGSEVARRLPSQEAVPLECLGRALYAWTRESGDSDRDAGAETDPGVEGGTDSDAGRDADSDAGDRRREYLTTNGVLVSGGRVRARNVCARLDFEAALTPAGVEADARAADAEGADADALCERRERIARVASGIVDMAVQRSFFERSGRSVPVGADRRYEIPIGGEIREQVARALERSLSPRDAAFVAERLPGRIAARVELASADSDGADPSAGGAPAGRGERPRGGGGRDGEGGFAGDEGEGGRDASGGEDPDADVWLSPPPELTFADVGGMDDLKADLREKVIHPLREPEIYERYGLGAVNGILLHGPPGTGKTYVTKALAGELEYAFVDINPADIVSKWVGEAAKQVGRVFDLARENQPCLIFIDELDAIAPRRDGGTHSTQSERQMLNQLLIELAEVQGERIVVVAATNKYEEVDDAIRRSGRFDERINVPPPDGASRLEILFTHLEGRPFDASSLDRDHVIERTRGYTASDMELVATNAARNALERERSTDRRGRICQSDVEAAIAETEPSLATADIDTWKWATSD